MVLLKMIITFMKIGLLSFGGGYAMLPLLREDFVNINHWISVKEWLRIVTVSQMTPGPIAVNAATFIGYLIQGFFGSLLATVSVVLPSVCIVMLVAKFLKNLDTDTTNQLFRITRLVVVGLIAVAGVQMFPDALIDVPTIVIYLVALGLTLWKKLSPLVLIFGFGFLGAILAYS
jgi:chromate transporter